MILCVAVALAAGCDKRSTAPDVSPDRYGNVVILYTDGYNNLSSDIKNNIKTMCKSPLPMKSSDRALLWVTHNSVNDSDYTTPTEPVVIRISSDWSGTAVMDTLLRLGGGKRLTDKEVMREALSFIKEGFKSDHYGVVFSSHGTGWLPEDYYSHPKLPAKGEPKLKTFGASYEGSSSHVKASHEITVKDMAEAFPFHPDYIIFDACLMGGIEVAYELKDVTDKIGFSAAEVLSSGFDYTTICRDLLVEQSPEMCCADYFNRYDTMTGTSRSATISLIDCSKLEALAPVCARLFERYRGGIATVNPGSVQGFFTGEKHWFYDLEDILVKAGMNEVDHAELKAAIDACVLYKASTPEILGKFKVNTFCGLSSFLPRQGTSKLREYYRTLAWDKATGLVE